MIAKMPSTPVKRFGFKPKSLLGLSISLLIWQPPGWADTLASALPQLNEESTPKVGFDTQVEGNTLTVNQSADKVILNWDSFNIGEQNAVHFQQVANGIALNKILDQAPSQILGSLTATGSIYLLNPNGVLFGQNSQVHVGNLLVSTQQVDTELFLKSNINNAIKDGKPALTAPGQAQGAIDIEKGAHISTESGGSVLVFAPSVTNAGTIRTPDGQTVLAASEDKVYLTSSDRDPDLRGVFVEVGTGGDVTNLGEIVAERGNVTLLGLAVNQEGRVRATSSVDVNGTIRLLARDGANNPTNTLSTDPHQLLAYGVDSVAEAPDERAALSQRAGDLTLGAGSLTQVTLEQPPQAVLVDEASLSAAALAQLKSLAGSKSVDIKDAAGEAFKGLAVTPAAYAQWQQAQADSPRRVTVLSAEGYIDQLAAERIQGATAVDASGQNPSKIELYGQHIELGEEAQVAAKGGVVKVVATDGAQPMNATRVEPADASVHLAKGASIDVSGSEVTLEMERNSLEVEVRGNEVRDQPLQRDGVLRGQKVRVDARLGTHMVDTKGSLEKQAKSVAERSVEGGSVQVLSEGAVDFDPQSQVNIKGGKVKYSGGELVTTGLIKDGKVVDISAADPNQVYEGLTTLSRYEEGYTDVQDAGQFEIKARNLQFDANVLAGQAPGQRQVSLKDQPEQGSLSVDLNYFDVDPNIIDRFAGQSVWLSPLRPEGLDLRRETWLNPQLINAAGLSQFDLFLRGDLTQERGADIHLSAGGQFTAQAQEIILAGTIDAAGGVIDLSSQPAVGRGQFANQEVVQRDGAQHAVQLLAGAHLDVSGNWVNRSASVGAGQDVVSVLDGGSVKLSSRGDFLLDAGASITANAGALLSANNTFAGGKGGAIDLKAAFPATAVALSLDADLSARGFSQNGSLSINVPELQIGKGEPERALKNATLFDYDFFALGGFGKYSFTTNFGGVDILPQTGSSFAWQQRNWVLKDNAYLTSQSNRTLGALTTSQLLPDYLRKPVSIKITQNRPKDLFGREVDFLEQYLHFSDGVDWRFDPLAKVDFSSINRMYIGGAIYAPGGELSFDNSRQSKNLFKYDPTSALWLGDDAWLSVAGTFVASPSGENLKLGTLINGGRIRFGLSPTDDAYINKGAKTTGRIISEEGSGIDVSAFRATFDVLGAGGYRTESRASDAGSLEFYVADGLLWQSNMLATSFRELGAKGASVNISVLPEGDLRSYANEERYPESKRGIDLFNQRQKDLLEGLRFGDALPANISTIEGDVAPSFNRVYLFSDEINRWDLDNLTLNTIDSVLNYSGAADKDLKADIYFRDSFKLATKASLNIDASEFSVAEAADAEIYAPWIILGEQTYVSKIEASEQKPGEPSQIPPIQPYKVDLPARGFLTFVGEQVELAGDIQLNGAAQTNLASKGGLLAHGAFGGAARENDAKLSSDGDISLIGSVLYPGSFSNVTIESTAPDGTLEIASNGQAAPKVLSAGGSLNLKAKQIEISGAISAPFGKVNLEGTDVHLAPSALVNVSGDNQLIPFGSIIGNDLDWLYSLNPNNSSAATRLVSNTPEKQVSIKADRILMDEGSRINLSGGGDLLGYQFAPGPTGSQDVLATSSLAEGFALLPAGNFVAYDSALQGQDAIPTGSRISLSNNPLLPAGDYYLLPSRYALLPGAYWVKPTGKLAAPGSSFVLPDGGVTLTGQLGLAHTNIHSNDWLGFTFYKSRTDGKSAEVLAPNGLANYKLRLSDPFFSQKEATANLPHALDAGSLVLDAQKALRLSSGINGQVRAGELGARVDILGADIHLVDQLNPTDKGLSLLAGDLSKLQVGSTLIGGRRDDAKPGAIEVSAQTVTVEENAKVTMPAVVLVAEKQVRVKTGAQLSATASATASASASSSQGAVLTLDKPAALLRLAGEQAQVELPEGSDGSKLSLDKGAQLKGNALLASAGETQLESTLALNAGGALSLRGGNMQLGGLNPIGAVTAATPGEAGSPAPNSGSWLYFAEDFFSKLGLKDVTLTAREQMRLAEGFNLSTTNLSLTAQSLTGAPGKIGAAGQTGAAVSLKADNLSLSGGPLATAEAAKAPEDAAQALALNIEAKQISLGAAPQTGSTSSQAGASRVIGASRATGASHLAIDGFKQVTITGLAGITGQGKTQLDVAGDLTLTGSVSTRQQGDLTINAQGKLSTAQGDPAAAAASAPASGLGGRISLGAAQLDIGSKLQAASGQVRLTSEGDINLRQGASLDVAGVSRRFGERTLYTPGGSLNLTSRTGSISLAENAQLAFGAQAGQGAGGGAGSLVLSAAEGALSLKGTINGRTASSDGGGALQLDAQDLGDMANLSAVLSTTFDAANTQNQLSLRQRQGDISIGAGVSFKAGSLDLTADQGAISLAGRLLSSVGEVGLWAKGDISLAASASIGAQNLSLASQTGFIQVASGSQLVKGAGTKPGELTLSASTAGLLGSRLEASTEGWNLNAEIWLREEAADGRAGLAQLEAMNAKAEAYLAANPDLFADLTPGQTTNGGLSLHAELYSSGDITVAEKLDLSNWRLGKTPGPAAGEEPSLEEPGLEEPGLEGDAPLDDSAEALAESGVEGDRPEAGDEQVPAPSNQANPGRAGRLTLRAGGDIRLDQSISDGFVADTSVWGSQFVTVEGTPLDALMSEDSSHINLISGADLTSSNSLNTLAKQGDAGSLHLADGVTLRTGTGDITIATQGNLEMADTGTATIYTAGKTQMRQYAGSDEALPDYGTVHPYAVNENVLADSPIPTSLLINKVYYPEAGGAINIRTGGDIQGSKSHQLINEWLHRAAGTFLLVPDPVSDPSDLSAAVTREITTWGIGFQDFSQGIASLGGGDLRIHSGGSINDLAVSSANTGKAVGEGLNNQVQQSLSGAVSIQAAGDINSGRWYGANNRFEVTSLGNMGNTQGELAAVIGLGDAPVKLTATGDLAVEAVFNPTQVRMGYQQLGSNPDSARDLAVNYSSVQNLFSSFGENSAISFVSLTGDVSLLNSQEIKNNSYLSELKNMQIITDTSLEPGINLFPGTTNVVSFTANINLGTGLQLAPQKNGQFQLVANGSLLANKDSQVEINQIDLLPEQFGTIVNPLTGTEDTGLFIFTVNSLWNSGGDFSLASTKNHGAQSVYRADSNNNWIYAATGDITKSGVSESKFVIASAKGLDVYAGRDIADTSLIFHHQDAAQHSSITTGGDLVFRESRDISNRLKEDKGSGVLVLGAGSLRIQAGKNISLGTSDGILSLGQGETDTNGELTQFNPYLPDKAADLFISAGIDKTPNYGGVMTQYLGKPVAQDKTFIELLSEANPERLINQLNLVIDQPVKTLEEARNQLGKLPLWQQQQVALGATRLTNSAAAPNYSRELVAYVTSASFDQLALQNALNSELGLKLEGTQAVQNALAALPIEQQHSIALKALGDGSSTLARNFLDSLVLSEIRQGGEAAIRQGLKRADPEGYERGYAALATLYPGIAKDNNPWAGSLAMDNTKIRTSAEADVNILLPGGSFEVGLETPTLEAADRSIGLVLGSYGDINVAAAGSINVNKSRIFNLGGGDVMLWSSYGDVDAGKGAKTALSVPPPKVQIDPNTGASRLVFPPAVAGSGIQATNPAPSNDPRAAISDGADVLLFAPAGIVDAGDAGISSTGNILVGALEFVGRDNVAGNVTISVASDTSVALPAGAGSVGNDAAQSAEKAADNASGSQKEERKLAYLTIELLGTGNDDEDEDEEEKRKKRTN